MKTRRDTVKFHALALVCVLLTSVVGISPTAALADEPPVVEWSRDLDENWASHSGGKFAQQTMDGGYLVLGGMSLTKTDSDGNAVWQQRLQQNSGSWLKGSSMQQTADGGYILAGLNFWSSPALRRTDSNGNIVWERDVGDGGNSIQQTNDGGYIIGGQWGKLTKTDSAGNVIWERIVHDSYVSARQTTDGGYITASRSSLAKTDSNGNTVWRTTLAGNAGMNDSIKQTTDGGYIVAGDIAANPDSDVYLVRLNSQGSVVWDRTYNNSDYDKAYSVQQTSDGGYVLAGYTGSYHGMDNDFYVIKTDSVGNEIWSKAWGGYGVQMGKSIQQTADGGYIVAGHMSGPGGGAETVTLVKMSAAPTSDATSPMAVADLMAGNVSATAVTLNWTAPGDDGSTGTASEYDIRMAQVPIAEGNWDSATPLLPIPAPNPAGMSEAVTAASLSPATTYYFALKTADEATNWSGLSNVATATTDNTPNGTSVPVDLGNVNITFNDVTGEGNTNVVTSQGNPAGAMPPNFRVRGQFVDVTTTATYTGPITVCIEYDPSTPNPENLKLFHENGNGWDDVTTFVDTANNRICGQVDSLSWFFIGEQWVWVDTTTAPVFPSLYVGIGAAFAAAVSAYVIRRRLILEG